MGDVPEIPTAEQIQRIRDYLETIRLQFPGNSIEVRVPFVRAVQCLDLDGAHHHRGTPPNVAEIGADVFLRIIDGEVKFNEALELGLINASGKDIRRLADVF